MSNETLPPAVSSQSKVRITESQRGHTLHALRFHYECSAIKSQYGVALEFGKPMRRQKPRMHS
jgi:hypothetical protein